MPTARFRSGRRGRLTPALAVLLALMLPYLPAQAQRLSQLDAQGEPPPPRELTLQPAAAPRPALAYRLFPLAPDRSPGNAAPMYLRMSLEIRDTSLEQTRHASDWLQKPLAEFPLREAELLADLWKSRLAMLEIASQRSTCQWDYPLAEQREDVVGILLPDVQGLRNWANLLALKARVEIARGQTEAAIRTIRTGLAMARHLGEGPFLVNQLVAAAVAQLMLDRVEELIARPDAPNLYWALSALPRPLIDFRDAFELEQKIGEWMIPELTDLDRERTPAEWDALVARLFERLKQVDRKLNQSSPEARTWLDGLDLEGFRDALRAEASREAAIPGSLPESQRLMLLVAYRYRTARDTVFQWAYLPYDQVRTRGEDETKAVLEPLKAGPLRVLVELLPAVQGARATEARLMRRIGTLRVLEAIRLTASQTGQFPESIDDLVVPVPTDPMSGQPYSLRREGDVLVLSLPDVGTTDPNRVYRITTDAR